jgi:hypothetical protein
MDTNPKIWLHRYSLRNRTRNAQILGNCLGWKEPGPILWVYDLMHYTTSCFGAAEPSAPDQGFEIDPDRCRIILVLVLNSTN